MPWVEIVGVIEKLGGILLVGIAIYGLNRWRREHVGRKRIDLAEETLAIFYEVSEVLDDIRSRMASEDEGVGEDGQYSVSRMIRTRFASRQELFNRMYALRYRFMSTFGKAAAEPFEKLHTASAKVRAAAKVLARLEHRGSHAKADEAAYEKLDAQVFGGADQDEISERIDKAVESMEAFCRNTITKDAPDDQRI